MSLTLSDVASFAVADAAAAAIIGLARHGRNYPIKTNKQQLPITFENDTCSCRKLRRMEENS